MNADKHSAAAATKEFYWDTDEHGYTRIISEEKTRNGKIVL
jgi:hypothetical protein